MAHFEDDESFEHTLLIVREVNAYKIPPRTSSGGYKCSEWLVSDRIWSGRLRLVSQNDTRCEIRLEDPNSGELFAACPVFAGNRDASVETVLDSSRFFVLKIDDGHGHHAFIGLGFLERNEAFDFNVALSDHEKFVVRQKQEKAEKDLEKESRQAGKASDHKSSQDFRLKDGETIRIKVKTSPGISASGKKLNPLSTSATSHIASVGAMKAPLAPPPGGSRIRQPLPPPTNDISRNKSTVALGTNAQILNSRPLSDMGKLEASLPEAKPAPSSVAKNNSTATGWAAF